MRRLVQTSSGSAMLDLNRYRGAGIHLRVTRFGPDGWEDGGRMWFEKIEMMTTPQTLEPFLAAELNVPPDEATALAQEIRGSWMQEWKSRGGEREESETNRLSRALMASVAALIGLALIGVGLLIWLLAT